MRLIGFLMTAGWGLALIDRLIGALRFFYYAQSPGFRPIWYGFAWPSVVACLGLTAGILILRKNYSTTWAWITLASSGMIIWWADVAWSSQPGPFTEQLAYRFSHTPAILYIGLFMPAISVFFIILSLWRLALPSRFPLGKTVEAN